MRFSLVYQFSCARCASEYVGSTIRTLHTRVVEDAVRSFRTESLLTVPPHSIRQHSLSCGVPVSIDNFKVMGNTKFPTDLLILEPLFIHKLKPKLMMPKVLFLYILLTTRPASRILFCFVSFNYVPFN